MVLFLPEINSMSARVLLFLVVPGHLIFFCVIYLVEGHSVPNSKTFVVFYLLAGLIQVKMTAAAAKQHSLVCQPAGSVPCLDEMPKERGWGFLYLRTQFPSSRGQVNLFQPKGVTQTVAAGLCSTSGCPEHGLTTGRESRQACEDGLSGFFMSSEPGVRPQEKLEEGDCLGLSCPPWCLPLKSASISWQHLAF